MLKTKFCHFVRIRQMVVALMIIVPNTTGQTPTISVTPNEVEIGSNLTAICHVTINHAIAFKVGGNQVGTCPIPIGGPQACTPLKIEQNDTIDTTTWTLTASTFYEGNWSCSRSTTNSASAAAVQMFKCPDSAPSENGINSDVALNDTSRMNITVETGCIYPSDNPEIVLQFKSGSKQRNAIMNCNAAGTACTDGNSYECNHQIYFDMPLTNDDKFEFGINYTLHFQVFPSVGDCDSVAIFDQYSLKFISTGHVSTTEEPTTTPEQSPIAVSIPYTASTHSNAIGSGKEVTETTFIISTDSYITTSNKTMVSETKNVFAPLVISVSLISFCFVVIFVVVIWWAHHKRRSYRQNTSGNYSDQEPPYNEGHTYQGNNKNYLQNRNENTKNSVVQYQLSHEQHPPEHDKYKSNNVIFYNGVDKRKQTIEMVYEPYALDKHIRFGRQSGRRNIQNNYILNHDQQRREMTRQQDLYYSHPKDSFYRG